MHHAHLTEAIDGGSLAATQTLDSLQASGMSAAQAMASVDRIINRRRTCCPPTTSSMRRR